VEVPPDKDGGSEEDEAEDLIAAEGAEMSHATGFGFFRVELWLGAVGHGAFNQFYRRMSLTFRTQIDLGLPDCRP
jgi:hypothetical protein